MTNFDILDGLKSLYDPFGSPYRGQKPSLPLKKEAFESLRHPLAKGSFFENLPVLPYR